MGKRGFQGGCYHGEGKKNGEIRKIPMDKKLTETFEDAKKVFKSEYVFSENGKPYRDVKPDLHKVVNIVN